MGCVMSIDKQIDQMYFKPFPTKAVKLEKIARTNDVIVAVAASGRLYTNQHRLIKKVCWTPGDQRFFDDVAVCLRKLGLVTPAQVRAHKAHNERMGKLKDARWRYRSVVRDLDRAGLELTDAQRAALREAAGKKPADNDDDARGDA